MIKDSGERREFDTGAVRDIQQGKGEPCLMPLNVIANFYKENSAYDILNCINKFTESGNTLWLEIALEPFLNLAFDNPETAWLETSIHFEEGALKYGRLNWQKGIVASCYVNSMLRHLFKCLRGDTDERHDRAFVWNVICCIWTCTKKPELNDFLNSDDKQ